MTKPMAEERADAHESTAVERTELRARVAELTRQRDETRAALSAVTDSPFWRITAPLRRLSSHLPLSWRTAFRRRTARPVAEPVRTDASDLQTSVAAPPATPTPPARDADSAPPAPPPAPKPREPLRLYPASDATPRVTVVLPRTAPADLDGPAGSAVLLARSVAHRRGATLRVVATEAAPDVLSLQAFGDAMLPNEPAPLESRYHPPDPGFSIPASPGDLYVATCPVTVMQLLDAVSAHCIIYLVARDDRKLGFAPRDSDHLMSILATPRLRLVVESQGLVEALRSAGLPPDPDGVRVAVLERPAGPRAAAPQETHDDADGAPAIHDYPDWTVALAAAVALALAKVDPGPYTAP